MSVADWFSTFCGNIAVDDLTTVRTRYRAIAKRLNQEYWNWENESAFSRYVGSFGRGTATRRTSDVDMLFQLPATVYSQHNAYVSNGQSALLQAVRNAIRKTYPATEIGGDGQVVVVSFTYGARFEVLPAFKNSDETYTYPDANDGGRWRITNPKAEIDAIRSRNSVCNGNLRLLCRMMRAWKASWDVPISGLLLDTFAYNFIGEWSYRTNSFMYYDWMSRDFFAYLANRDSTQHYWLAPGSGQYVWRSNGFEYKAKRCHNIALTAIEHEGKKEHWRAKNKWREIYGSDFPS